MKRWDIATGDSLAWLKSLPDNSVHCWVTSPPYFALRDYGVEGQIGLEKTVDEFIARLVELFREARRVLHPTGTLWCNMGDSYGGGKQGGGCVFSGGRTDGRKSCKGDSEKTEKAREILKERRDTGFAAKQLMGVPWMLAFALRADGWYLRSDIIWAKPNAMPESVRDRPSKSHEYLFLMTKEPRYFFDGDAVRRPQKTLGEKHEGKSGYQEGHPSKKFGYKNLKRELHPDGAAIRSVWTIPVGRYKHAHFATFPRKLVVPCVRAGTSEKGCCPTCLTPWRRVVKKDRKATRPAKETKTKGVAGDVMGNRDPERHCTTTQTVGWKQGCDCPPAEPIPCLVGDMFAGSGTTLAVAVDEGRRAIGCELNPKYVALIHRRMKTVVPSMF